MVHLQNILYLLRLKEKLTTTIDGFLELFLLWIVINAPNGSWIPILIRMRVIINIKRKHTRTITEKNMAFFFMGFKSKTLSFSSVVHLLFC